MRTLLVLSLVLSGCYQAIGVPEIPKLPRPTVRPGEPIVATDEVRELRTFHVTRRGDLVRDTQRSGTASYAGDHLTFPELSSLADPGWDQTVADLHDMRSTCRRAIIPEAAGILAVAAMSAIGIGIIATHKGDGDLSDRELGALNAAYIAGGAGIASYAIGWVIGGRKCGELSDARHRLHIDDGAKVFYENEVELVNRLARDFNRRGGAAAREE